jgi:propionyl-CoA synthetase
MRHAEVYERSLLDPEGFWAEAASALRWRRPFERVRDHSRAPFTRWFTGGQLNTCENAVDVHVESARGEERALVYECPVTGAVRSNRYRELRDEVARLAGALARAGVGRGDRVLIYMPMVPETVFAMLACARIGAVHSVVFGGFGDTEALLTALVVS